MKFQRALFSAFPNSCLRPALRTAVAGALVAAAAAFHLMAPHSSAEENASDKGPAFHDDFEKARAASVESGKPLIAIFSASWCPPCQTMRREVYPSAEVRPHHDHFVWAYLDADEAANRPVMSQFKVSGIPHVAFVSPEGRILGHFAGAVPAKDFAEILKDVSAKASGSAGSGTKGSGTEQGAAPAPTPERS